MGEPKSQTLIEICGVMSPIDWVTVTKERENEPRLAGLLLSNGIGYGGSTLSRVVPNGAKRR